MARTERSWNTDFQSYMEFIVNNPVYKGLPIERKRDGSLGWLVTGKSKIGRARQEWIDNKAREMGYAVQYGSSAQVMREIHPTKQHICQICGSCMSIYYLYPSVSFLKAIKKEFGLEFSECDHIDDIWEQILDDGISEDSLRLFFKNKFELPDITQKDKDSIIAMCEYRCRVEGKKQLSPGVMANPPDRFDGFHSYNRCCRAEQDTGRSKENMKSYTKDRRAYEYWSDGNIHAANEFMGSQFFKGKSADHIGPISLGFVHDPHYLRPMSGNDNSAKRDRLLVEDIEAILEVETDTGIYPMSWYSAQIWDFIKTNYSKYPHLVSTIFRDMLKQNMANFMFILKTIIDETDKYGADFLYNEFILPKANDFEHTYTFREDGSFSMTLRHRTERSANEFERFKRIAFTAVDEYGEKTNRHVYSDLVPIEIIAINRLCDLICKGTNSNLCRKNLESLIINIQERLINNVKILNNIR